MCNLKFGECCVLKKETNVKFGYTGDLLDCVNIYVGVLPKLNLLETIGILSFLLIIVLGIIGYPL